jgi:hypothetical protein
MPMPMGAFSAAGVGLGLGGPGLGDMLEQQRVDETDEQKRRRMIEQQQQRMMAPGIGQMTPATQSLFGGGFGGPRMPVR